MAIKLAHYKPEYIHEAEIQRHIIRQHDKNVTTISSRNDVEISGAYAMYYTDFIRM